MKTETYEAFMQMMGEVEDEANVILRLYLDLRYEILKEDTPVKLYFEKIEDAEIVYSGEEPYGERERHFLRLPVKAIWHRDEWLQSERFKAEQLRDYNAKRERVRAEFVNRQAYEEYLRLKAKFEP